MKKYCTFIPSIGNKLFSELRSKFDYDTAKNIFLIAINPKFKEDYKSTLSLDAEGIPTYESIINNKFIISSIDNNKIAKTLSKDYSPKDNTKENYSTSLEEANDFNRSSDYKTNYIATVEPNEDNTIQVVIKPRTDELTKEFNDSYSANKVAEKISEELYKTNIAKSNIDLLDVNSFNTAKSYVNDLNTLNQRANNISTTNTISKDFSNFIVQSMQDEPIVSRAINLLINNTGSVENYISDDIKNDSNASSEDIAYDILSNMLSDNISKELNIPSSDIIKRAVKFMNSRFKAINTGSLNKSVIDAKNTIDNNAKDIEKSVLQNNKEKKEDDNTKAADDLESRIDRNLKILNNALKTEVKRARISKSINKAEARQEIGELSTYTKDRAKTIEGLMRYASTAVSTLKGVQSNLKALDSADTNSKFYALRQARSYIQSYGAFIKAMRTASLEEADKEDNMFSGSINIDGNDINTGEIIRDLNELSENITLLYNNKAIKAFAEFLKPFLGDKVQSSFNTYAKDTMSIEDMLTSSDGDITFADRFLDSMADSGNTVLQLFDKVVKTNLDVTRLATMNDVRDIQSIMTKAKSYGISSFDWMFETDSNGNKTGNYISEINHGQFDADIKNFNEELDAKYGKNPSGDKAQQKIAERQAWRDEHAMDIIGNLIPDEKYYHNRDFDKLSGHQKEILNNIMALKSHYDSRYPSDRVSSIKAIQNRKDSFQRFADSTKSVSDLFTNIKEAVGNSFLEKPDDDQEYGDTSTKRGMTDFEGNEFMTLPILYTNKLENPNELSTDIFSSLMSYAYASNNYSNMSKIIDPMEIGKSVVLDNMKVHKTRDGKKIQEKFKKFNIPIVNDVYQSDSNIKAKLNDFFESKVYNRYLKDEGTFDVLGKTVNTNKTVNTFMHLGSTAMLGFNFLANIANVTTGLGMQNIEAASGEYFNASELLKADKAYTTELLNKVKELGSNIKTNKLDLFDELFDIRQDYRGSLERSRRKKLLQRIFGENIAFLGQDGGDHWLYNRTAIAMAMREKVKLDGKVMSLWDALHTVNLNHEGTIKQLNYRNITNVDGSTFNVGKFGRKVASINQAMFGIYNEEDQNAASRVSVGRLLQQYRKWMKVQMNYRFEKGRTDLATENFREGYYRTIGRTLNELRRGQVQLSTVWSTLSNGEKANIKRGMTEMLQLFAVWGLANIIDFDVDDKNRPWALKLAEYISKRSVHELGGLAPSPIMLQEDLKTLANPLPITSTIGSVINLACSVVDPTDWVDSMKSGPYKGLSTLEKNFIKAPIPGVAQYRQIDKFAGNIDTSIQYYTRPNANN